MQREGTAVISTGLNERDLFRLRVGRLTQEDKKR
jgi:hypothetical protein